jgi:hypothetical protein
VRWFQNRPPDPAFSALLEADEPLARRAREFLCFGSQTPSPSGRILLPMSVKYYTQFRLTDAWYRGGNEYSGVVELSRPMDQNSDISEIEAALARNFDLQRSAVKLLSWARLQ